VAEELHFGRAAQRIGISQPPLSQQIKAFEDEIGAPLFDRSKHKVALTTTGEALLPEALRLLEQADRVRSVAMRSHSDLRRRLRVTSMLSVLFDVLPPILDRLRASHPEVTVTIHDTDAHEALGSLQQGKADLAIVRVDKLQAPLRKYPLMRDHYIAALPSRHALTPLKAIPLANLAGEPLILYERQLSPEPYDAIIAACVNAGFSPDIAYTGSSVQACLGYVACKLGVSIVPAVLRQWRVPGVVFRDLETPIRAKEVSLVWNTQTRNEAVDQFLAAATAQFPRPK
jgi:DNA-binding transcriptional LysR family regulator